jgi:predicted secreted protein
MISTLSKERGAQAVEWKMPPLAEQEILAVLQEVVQTEPPNWRQRNEQIALVQALPPDFEDQLRAKFRTGLPGRGVLKTAQSRKRFLSNCSGLLFEFLCLGDQRWRSHTDQFTQTLEALMDNPSRFRMPHLQHQVVPDIILADNRMIVGWVECKAVARFRNMRRERRRVPNRPEQLVSFENSLRQFLEKLRKVGDSDLQASGLEIIAQNRDRLRLARNLRRCLCIPRQFSTDRKALEYKEHDLYYSPFSSQELKAITIHYLEKFGYLPGPGSSPQE